MQPDFIEELLDSNEVCETLGIDRSTLSRWVSADKIRPALKRPGLRQPMFFLRTDVEALRKPAKSYRKPQAKTAAA